MVIYNSLTNRFNLEFAEDRVFARIADLFPELEQAPFGLSLINGILRVPKEKRTSLVLYGAVDAMLVLYLAITRSFASIYRAELKLDWTDQIAVGWGKAQDVYGEKRTGLIRVELTRRYPTRTQKVR